MERWAWVLIVLGGAWGVKGLVAEGDWRTAGIYGVGALALAFVLSPWWRGRSPTHAAVTALPVSERAVVIYWRPGCVFCMRLRARLRGVAHRARWVNIWQDRDAAAFVRQVNRGSETVPTVVMDGEPLTNPDPDLVRARLE